MNPSSFLSAGMKTLRAHLVKDTKFPLGVYMVITERCPNACVYCNYSQAAPASAQERLCRQEMTTKEALNIIGYLHKLGMRKLHLTGGEPLLRDDLEEIINFAKAKRIFVGLSSSGVFLPKKVGGIRNVDIVMLSLDGEKDIHDSLRGTGSFQRTVQAMESLKKNKITHWTTTVLNSKNIHSIDYILRMAEEKKFFANFVIPQYRKDNYKSNLPKEDAMRNLIPRPEDLRQAIKYLIKRKRQGARIGSTFAYLNYILDWEDYSALFSSKIHKKTKCWAGRLSFHIDAQGFIYACGLGAGRMPGIDIKAADSPEILNKIRKVPGCNSCMGACNIENNLLFSLNSEAILNWIKKL
ncbi:MAG: radical SAM protein [Candidatus Omnitrophota bacterium]